MRQVLADVILGFVLLAICGCNRSPFSEIRLDGYPFPQDFLWGVAVAAHQVEGGNDNNDWWEWEQLPGKIHNGDKSGDAVGFARNYPADIGLAKELGIRAFRLSLEWSRLEPTRGSYDPQAVRYYHAVLTTLRHQGLRPFVTLFHFTSPRWWAKRGGWEDAQNIADFERFVQFCAREFGREVDDWITINEPNIYGFNAYDQGEWPPGKKERSIAIKVMAHQILGHARAAKALRAIDTQSAKPGRHACRLGLANHVIVIEPWNRFSPIDQIRARIEDQVFNVAALEAVRTGVFKVNMPGSGQIEVSDPDLAGSVDFIGLNYYSRRHASGLTEYRIPDGAPRNDLNWEIYPEGLYLWLDRLRTQALPIFITENGVADREDRLRPAFVVQHLMRIWQAIDAGISLKGYFYWSLMDNFEWKEGFEPRFGLYRVDYSRSNTSRQLTKGGEIYSRIVKENRLSAETIRQFGY